MIRGRCERERKKENSHIQNKTYRTLSQIRPRNIPTKVRPHRTVGRIRAVRRVGTLDALEVVRLGNLGRGGFLPARGAIPQACRGARFRGGIGGGVRTRDVVAGGVCPAGVGGVAALAGREAEEGGC